jgi:hypothetical protein
MCQANKGSCPVTKSHMALCNLLIDGLERFEICASHLPSRFGSEFIARVLQLSP